MVALIIDLAHRTGLLEAAAQGSGTSADLADRAGLTERYARECLGSQVTAGIIDYDRAARTYQLPAEHAVVLTGPGSLNLAPLSQVPTLLAHHVDGVAQVAGTVAVCPTRRSGRRSPRPWTACRGAPWTAS
jgi:DNA-binding IclR family transcriptional regulator